MEGAIKVCQVDEISSDSNRMLETRGAGLGSAQVQVDVVGARGGRGAQPAACAARRPSGSLGQCGRCGGQCADATSCPALTVQCYVCENHGHFARMCKTKKESKNKKMYDIAVRHDDKSDSEDSESFYISALHIISEINSSAEDWFETLRGKRGNEKFKLDTGADINVLSYHRFLALGFTPNIIDTDDKIRLQAYSGDLIPLKGVCYLKWGYKNKKYSLKFAIAEMNCQSVLGRQSCLDLGLIKRIHDIKSENADLFSGLGCLPGEYHIVVDKSIPHVVCARRNVPLGLRNKLLGELNRMVQLEVIRKVNHPTPWVNSLVVVAKKNGQFYVFV